MFHSSILSLFLATSFTTAAIIPDLSTLDKRVLASDDVILWGSDGRMEVMKKADFEALSSTQSSAFNITTSTPTSQNTTFSNSTVAARSLGARGCDSTYFTMNEPESFLNWDVPMSSVVKGETATTTISVTQGYTITNSITVGISSTFTLVKDFLSTSLSINYGQSWASSYTAAYSFSVPEGKYGVVVSNPYTTRQSGYVDTGCVGSTERSYFQADSYASKAYGSLSWVDGLISVCLGDEYPLPMCLGGGTHT